jgi:hypothetical protein
MKKLILVFILLPVSALLSRAANRYWVATSPSNWNNTANWSTTSGGIPGASVPGPLDIAFFSPGSIQNCLLNINVTIAGIRMQVGYTGQVQLNGFNLIVNTSNADVQNGSIVCGTNNLTVTGSTTLGGSGTINCGSGISSFATVTLNGGTFIASSNKIFISNNFNVNNPASFLHNNGAVEITGNNNDDIIVSGGANASVQFSKFIVNKPVNTNFLGIQSGDTLIINDSAILINGGLNTGGVLNAKANLWVQSTFDGNSNPIRMEGSGTSRLILDRSIGISGGASLIVNKVNATDSLLIVRSAGSGTIIDGQTGNAFTIARGIVAYPQNNRVQISYNSVTILANGRFIATGDSLFNAGAHDNSAAGRFFHNNGVYIFTGTNRTYNVASVPDTFFHVVLNKPGGSDNLDFASGDSMLIQQNLTIVDGQLNGLGTIGGIKLEGNLNSSSLMTATNLGLAFTGSNNQTVLFSGAATSNWNGDVRIHKNAGTVTLLSVFRLDAGTTQELTFVSGKFVTTNTNILIIGGTTVVTGANNNSFTEGPVSKVGNQTFVFPIGKGTIYAPVRISNFVSSSGSTQFRVEYFRANPHPTYDRTSKDVTITSLSSCEYWFLDRLNTSATVRVGLSYDASRSCGFTSFPALKVIRWNGTRWVDHLNDNLGPAGFVTSSANVTAFSPFTLGASIFPLPVELNSFEAKADAVKVTLNWSTATEINSDRFEVQRSNNGNDFMTLQTVTAAGFSAQILNYSTFDNSPAPGRNYYRLKMIDKDSSFKYSAVRTVMLEQTTNSKLRIYPNPITGDAATIQLREFANQTVGVRLFHKNGQLLLHKQMRLNADGTAQLTEMDKLQTGMYMLQVQSKTGSFTERLIIQ